MITEDRWDPSVGRLASELWRVVADVGRVAAAYPDIEHDSSKAQIDRVRLVFHLFTGLEAAAGLRFDPADTVLYADTLAWPDPGVTGGWVGDSATVRPSDVIQSYLSAWSLYQQCRTEKLPDVRPLRNALNVCYRAGLEDALRYLLAIPKVGVPVDPSNIYNACRALMTARAAATSDRAAVEAVLGRDASTVADWRRVEGLDLSMEGWGASAVLPYVDLLTEIAVAEVEAAREAKNADEWCRRQLYLHALLSIVLSLTGVLDLEGEPFLRTLRDQWEEIRADAGAYVRLLRAARNSPPFMVHVTAINMVAALQGAAGVPLARVRRERAAVPNALPDSVFRAPRGMAEPEALPVEWQALSPMLASVVADHLGLPPAELTASDVGVSTEQAATLLETTVGRAQALGDSGRPGAAVDLLRAALRQLPWSGYLHWELAIALDASGSREAALPHAILAATTHPQQPDIWTSVRVIGVGLGDRHLAAVAATAEEFLRATRGS